MTTLVRTPTYATSIPQTFVVEPQKGPGTQAKFLEKFPDSLYNKSPDSILVKMLFTLLGPVGSGILQQGYLDARLALESYGIDGFNLDRFYGDPFKFSRLVSETYSVPFALQGSSEWEAIRSKDAQYRNRAIKFLAGSHLGPTLNGLSKVAESGIDSEVDIFERYRYLFDRYADIPLGTLDIGHTNNVNEVVVTPVADSVSVSETEKFYMDSALSRIKPVDVLITLNDTDASNQSQVWSSVSASSEFAESIQFVTGSDSIVYPAIDDVHWLKPGEEVEAKKQNIHYRYEFLHRPNKVWAYRDPDDSPTSQANESVHIGPYLTEQTELYSVLSPYSSEEYRTTEFVPEYGIADPRSMLRATGVIDAKQQKGALRAHTIFNFNMIDSYLSSLPETSRDVLFWSSRDGVAGDEDYFEIDLGSVKAVNFVAFETLHKPFSIAIEYDQYGSDDRDDSVFVNADKSEGPGALRPDPQRGSVWANLQYLISDSDTTIFTRFVRIRFTRLENSVLDSWTAEVRGLRIGRVS